MWWIIGLLAGLFVGGAIYHGEGALVGAFFGTILGIGVSLLQKSGKVTGLESRIQSLEAAVKQLQRDQVDLLRRIAGGSKHDTTESQVAQALSMNETGTLQATEPADAPGRNITSQDIPAPDIPAPVAPEPAAAAETSLLPSTTLEPSVNGTGGTESAPPGGEVSRLWNWLTGGNALVRVGVVVLFFGVAFLLKYAYEHTHVPIELRLTAVAVGAIVMLLIGWRLRMRNPVYALAIQGGGIGVLYLVVFGAFRLFHLLPGGVAFVILVAIAILSAILAILQNAQSLAILGVSGGFLAPILASTGGGSHIMLFSYYAVLNAGILGIALYKAWRPLNVVGFLFTFGIGSLWGARFYRDDLFASTEPFLILFFLMYVAIAVIFAFRQAPRLKHYVDATLVFGTPLVGFGLQTRLVQPFEYGAAWSAVVVAALYLGLGTALYRQHKENLRLLVEAFFALGVIFVTLAIPLSVDGRWTSAAWALEGAAAYWVGVHQQRKWPRVFGLLLQLAAGIAFAADYRSGSQGTPVLNTFYLGTVFIALSGLFSNYTIERHAKTVGFSAMQAAMVAFLWGLAWWVFGGLHEIHHHVPRSERIGASLVFLTGTATAFSALFSRGWWIARFPALALPPVITAALAMQLTTSTPSHPLAGFGLLAWPAAFMLHFLLLRRDDSVRTSQSERGLPELNFIPLAHASGLWLLAVAGALELSWQIRHIVAGTSIWPLVGWALMPVVLIMITASNKARTRWPVSAYTNAYVWTAIVPLVAYLFLWSLYANWTSSGDQRPLPYLPLLNPLDITQMLAFAAVIAWWCSSAMKESGKKLEISVNWKWGLFGGLMFYWLNGVLLRTLHHWGGIPHDFGAMMKSALAQTSLSIFWSVLALSAMLYATRNTSRALWMAGAALMAIVVGKLFIIDLAHVGGVERIVSFLAVGVLMLVIGYVAPVPPRQQQQEPA